MEGGGCEEFVDGMFLWRLSPHSAPALPPSPRLGHLPPPDVALWLFLPPKQQPTDAFFPSPPSLQAANTACRVKAQAVSQPPPPCRMAPAGAHTVGSGCMQAWRGHACVLGEKFGGKDVCSFPYPPCGSQPLTFRKFSLMSDLSLSCCSPFPPLPMEVY